MKYELRPDARFEKNKELAADLRRVLKFLKKKTLTSREYQQHGKYGIKVFKNRFGSWNSALRKAGMKIGFQKNITDKELVDIWKGVTF